MQRMKLSSSNLAQRKRSEKRMKKTKLRVLSLARSPGQERSKERKKGVDLSCRNSCTDRKQALQ